MAPENFGWMLLMRRLGHSDDINDRITKLPSEGIIDTGVGRPGIE